MFSRALAVPAAAVALAATVSLFAPAAQASSPPGVQRTGTQLASVLLPLSYFPPGYKNSGSRNSGSGLEHGPARYNVNTMNCKKLIANPPVTGYGETAAALTFVYGPAPVKTGITVLPTYLQMVYQFATPAAAAAYFQADYASYLRCRSGSAAVSNVRVTWTTLSERKGHFGGHRAFYADVTTTTTVSGSSGFSHGYVQVVLVGTDTVTLTASGAKVPARPAPAAVLAALIARVRG